jgi:hypothetical protein
MAWIPMVERAFGQDRLARWHRWTGFTSFWLIAHVVLITLGYAAAAHANAFAELWDMIWAYPGMLLARRTADAVSPLATVMFLLLAVHRAGRGIVNPRAVSQRQRRCEDRACERPSGSCPD